MLTDQDKNLIRQQYPGLSIDQDTVFGILEFTAVYNPQNQDFLILSADGATGIGLHDRYEIKIEPRLTVSFSKLPALTVLNIEPDKNRHFNQLDSTACLCSPLEESDFLVPEFDFKKYLEQLVIPFLYGQTFYSENGYWPWEEFSHEINGLLESYAKSGENPTVEITKQFLDYLKMYVGLAKNPQLYQTILSANRPSKKPCLCGSGKLFRDCKHLLALDGLKSLKNNIAKYRIKI
jgi:hypothetical protein